MATNKIPNGQKEDANTKWRNASLRTASDGDRLWNDEKSVPRTAGRLSLPKSLPNPDCLNPPNGAATSVLLYVLTKTVPACSFSVTYNALLRSRVMTPEARPNSVALARRRTPSTSLKTNHVHSLRRIGSEETIHQERQKWFLNDYCQIETIKKEPGDRREIKMRRSPTKPPML